MAVKTATVLIVDEDTVARTAVSEVLSRARYQVMAVGSFEEAKTVLAARTPDLLITELRLGAYNGLHLMLRARPANRSAAIILTAFPDPVLEIEARRQGAEYLVKPLMPIDLLTAASRVLIEGRTIPCGQQQAPRDRQGPLWLH